MAGHADVNGGDRCGGRDIRPAMAKKTVDLQLSRVLLMAKGKRLPVLSSEIGAPLRVKKPDNQRGDNDDQGYECSRPLPHDQYSPLI